MAIFQRAQHTRGTTTIQGSNYNSSEFRTYHQEFVHSPSHTILTLSIVKSICERVSNNQEKINEEHEQQTIDVLNAECSLIRQIIVDKKAETYEERIHNEVPVVVSCREKRRALSKEQEELLWQLYDARPTRYTNKQYQTLVATQLNSNLNEKDIQVLFRSFARQSEYVRHKQRV